ncbi:MAG: hypothetical protein OES34_12090 [Nitrosopumilus sp.]|nr:hypothetical protein [Nitrosopumilus sp.]
MSLVILCNHEWAHAMPIGYRVGDTTEYCTKCRRTKMVCLKEKFKNDVISDDEAVELVVHEL